MASTKYRGILDSLEDGLVQRDVSLDDDTFADEIAAKLLSLLHRRHKPISNISTSLQGNLCEFCTWELGENHWLWYAKGLSWPANAKTPWRDTSKSGIDIFAIDNDADTIYLVEIKSTKTGGSGVVAGDTDSLKEDFQKLFAREAPEKRIWGSVDEAVADLTIRGHRDLAERIIDGVGDTPQECSAVQLVGVLVCKSGQREISRQRRNTKFEELGDWLQSEGWNPTQCEYRCIELEDFEGWLWRVVRQVTE
jgi:hypothetical protein